MVTRCLDSDCRYPVMPGGRFCGACGAPLARLELILEQESDEGWGPAPSILDFNDRRALRLRLRNQGVGAPVPLGTGTSFSEPEWAQFAIPSDKEELPPGGELLLPLTVVLPKRLQPTERLSVGLQLADRRLECSLVFSVPPKLTLEAHRPSYLLSRENATQIRAEVRSRLGAWAPDRLESTTEGVMISEWRGSLVTPQKPLELTFTLDSDLCHRLLEQAEDQFTLDLRAPDGTELQTVIRLTRPPRPNFADRPIHPRLDLHTLSGRENRSFELRVTNGAAGEKGRAPWRLASVNVSGAPEGCEFKVLEPALPSLLASGESLTLKFTVRTETYPVGFTLLLSAEGADWEIPTRLERRRCQPFPGWLLLDIGTRSSCALALDSRLGRSEQSRGLVHLESAILYQSVLPEKRFQVGEPPDDGQWAVVTSMKRNILTGNRNCRVTPTDQPLEEFNLANDEVLADFLEGLISAAQDRLVSQGRSDLDFERVLFCYPARATEEQRDRLEQALREALRRCLNFDSWRSLTVVHVMESVAAALYFLNQTQLPAGARQQESVKLLVHDLGGSTLDLCLMEVNREASILSWKVLGVGGDTEVGGERIIEAVEQVLLKVLQQTLPPGGLLRGWDAHPEALEEGRIRKLAENLTIAFCDSGESRGTVPLEKLHYLSGGEPAQVSLDTPIRIRLNDLVPELESLFHRSETCTDRLLSRTVSAPDVIIQAGRGSKFPLVRQRLKTRFPNSKLLIPEEPKLCVVLGAAFHPTVCSDDGSALVVGDQPQLALHSQREKLLTGSVGYKGYSAQGPRFCEIFPMGLNFGGNPARNDREGFLVTQKGQRVELLLNLGGDDGLFDKEGEPNPEVKLLGEALLPDKVGYTLTLAFLLDSDRGLVVAQADEKLTPLAQIPWQRFAAEI